MVDIFNLTDYDASIDEMKAWLSKEDNSNYEELNDKDFSLGKKSPVKKVPKIWSNHTIGINENASIKYYDLSRR